MDVTPENVNRKPDNSPEAKSARNFIKSINTLDFDKVTFAVEFASQPLEIRRRFLDIVFVLLRVWETKYDNQNWNSDEELEFLVDVKRMVEAITPYYHK